MPRKDLLVRVAAAVVGIVAVAMAAATIRSPLEPGGDDGTGIGDGDGGQPTPPQDEVETVTEVPAFLEYLSLILLLLLAAVVAWYLIFHRRELVRLIAVVLGLALVVGIIAYALLEFSGAPEFPDQGVPNETEPESEPGDPGEGDGERAVDPLSMGPLLAFLAVLTAIFAGALTLGRSAGDEETTDAPPEPDSDEERATAVGTAAGRAADRIETADDDVDNEVYRAWRDMTGLLEVEKPETSTPGEFADAAVDAGIDREHVAELTRLFEDVRYGHRETTAEMEERAVSVFRRIESTYATDDETANEGQPDRRGDAE